MRLQRSRGTLVALALMGCVDALSIPNPANCVTSGIPCAEGMSCNPATQRCEPDSADCTLAPLVCSAAEVCDPGSKRCLPQRFVLGQPDDRSNLNTRYGLNRPIAAKLLRDPAGGQIKLAVVDKDNSRVLIWNDVPTQNRPADAVLGQPGLETIHWINPGDPSQSRMLRPWSVASDGMRLVVSDHSYYRLLIWNSIPTQIGGDAPPPASAVWGQHDLTSTGINAGQAAVNALGITRSFSFAESGTGQGFYVSDYQNRRVLVFAGIPDNDNSAPKWVIGQPDFKTGGLRSGPADLGGPFGLYSDGSQLFVTDFDRHRVLIYNLPITGNQPTPDRVIGQPDLVSGKANRGGAPGPDTLNAPADVAVTTSGGKRLLWVADSMNSRVLRYTLPSSMMDPIPGQADLVLGQADFTANLANRGGAVNAGNMWSPASVSSDGDGTRLVVADRGNNRVLIWRSLPMANGQPGEVILGQPDAYGNAPNMPPAVHALQFASPTAVSSDGQRLLVADQFNHRVLIWNQVPKQGTGPPDVVLGQPSFAEFQPNSAGLSARGLFVPWDVCSDGTRLAVADTGNHRVLIWNQIPTQNFAPADVVLGQPTMQSNSAGVSATAMTTPECVSFYQGSLFVCDSLNHRVLRFDPPYLNHAAAQLVLGQPDMATSACNQGGSGAQWLCVPDAVASDAGRVLIVDSGNQRVLVWNAAPVRNFQPADVVMGAPAFDRLDPAQPLRNAGGIAVQNGRVFVGSLWQNHILYWHHIPTENGVPADGVLGQPDMLSSLSNNHALPPVDRLSGPAGIAIAGGRLFIADQFNDRVVSRELPQ